MASYSGWQTVSERWLALSVWERDQHGMDLNGDDDSDDRIIVSGRHNHRVQVFDSAGNFLLKFGSTGRGDGQFRLPWAVAVDSTDKIIVADSGNNRVQVLFRIGASEPAFLRGECNDDGEVDISDAVWLLNFLFVGGPPPVEPFPVCGPGLLAADKALGCMTRPKTCQP